MTTSGTYTFAPDAEAILAEAWERIGKTPEMLTADIARSARRSLQFMLNGWSAQGLNLWTIDSTTVQLVHGVNTITTATGTMNVLECTVTRSGIESLMTSLGRVDYVQLATKNQQGKPSQYWTERVLPTPVIHLFPTPENSTDTLTYWRFRLPMDINGAVQTPEIPNSWLDAMASGLAVRLAQKFSQKEILSSPFWFPLLQKDAETAFRFAAAENRELVPFVAKPRYV